MIKYARGDGKRCITITFLSIKLQNLPCIMFHLTFVVNLSLKVRKYICINLKIILKQNLANDFCSCFVFTARLNSIVLPTLDALTDYNSSVKQLV